VVEVSVDPPILQSDLTLEILLSLADKAYSNKDAEQHVDVRMTFPVYAICIFSFLGFFFFFIFFFFFLFFFSFLM
jgi:hypothetical protein